MKILFVSRKYHQVVGGVERMSITIMNEMITRGHDVYLLSWDLDEAQTFYPLDDKVIWHKLNLGDADKKAAFSIKIKRAKKARSIIKGIKPDVIIAFQDGAFRSIKTYSFGLGIPVIAAERNAPSRFDFIKAGRQKNMIFNSFRFAKNITVQCESYRNDYPAFLRSKIVTIPNPVSSANKFAKPGEDNNYTLLSVGRLSYQKNYTVLVNAFAQIAPEFPNWTLKIVGGGEDSQKIQALINNHKLHDQVTLTGETDDIESHYIGAHLFCLPSLWEGFPNALAEAMSHGLPSVGFAQCAGVRDLIKDGENGLLAQGNDNRDTLADTLKKLMTDHSAREVMGKSAILSMKNYEPEKIFKQWEDLFKSASQS